MGRGGEVRTCTITRTVRFERPGRHEFVLAEIGGVVIGSWFPERGWMWMQNTSDFSDGDVETLTALAREVWAEANGEAT
jgi:hypothetical protein